jgi:Ca-activated chloride channel family protein
MKILTATLIGFCLLVSAPAWAFDPFAREQESVEAGNNSYTEQHFDQALDLYEQAELEVEQEPKIHYNRGAALFKLGRPKEAREAYLRASGLDDPQMKKQNYYNIGNTFLAEGAFHDAVPYYRRALEIDPGFDDARYNLELALMAIKQQEQQQQQQQDGQSDQQDKKEGQDQKKEEQQKDEEKEGSKDQGKDEKEQEDKQEGEQQDQKEQEKDQQQEQQDQKDQEGQKDQKEQEGQEDQKEQEKDQQAEKQEGQEQQGDQKEQQEQQEKQEEKQAGKPKPQPKKIPGQLTQAEFRDLLDSMRESEKPFQMHKFELPEYRQQQKEKDW